jgi:hypothetical protein
VDRLEAHRHFYADLVTTSAGAAKNERLKDAFASTPSGAQCEARGEGPSRWGRDRILDGGAGDAYRCDGYGGGI